MTKLVKTRYEFEGEGWDELSIVEDSVLPNYPPETKFEVIGKDIPRVDGFDRVTGKAVYTYDVKLPGMLYASVLRSPYPHAEIKRIDISKAAEVPGVRAVLTYQNSPQISYWNKSNIFDHTARFVGDEVAAVAAEDKHIADDALKLIAVEYETLPFVLDPELAIKEGAPRVHSEGNLLPGTPRKYSRGNVDKGFKEADIVIEETFHTQSALQNCMEVHGTVASWKGDELTVWESTQSINRVRDQLAETFNLPLSKVRVICQFMGGGFGSKQYGGKWTIIAALLAKQTGRPVQLMMNRHEENIAAGNRIPTVQHIKMGARRDGTLTGIELAVIANLGAYGMRVLAVEGPAQMMYNCQNVRTELKGVFTNLGHQRSFRGPGYTEGAFVLESMMDEVASRLNMDPMELRIRNHAEVDPRSGRSYSAKNLLDCYRIGAEKIGWRSGKSVNTSNGTKRRAMGMAGQMWGGGGGPPAYAWLRLNSDLTVEVMLGSQDIGTGTKTVFAQIAAEELGMELSKVTVHMGDTGGGPYAPVSWGSMTVSSVGPAVRQAALDVRNQLHEVAAGFVNISPGQVEIKGGSIYMKGDDNPRASLEEMAEQIGDFTILGKGSRGPNKEGVEVRTFGAQFAEVEVDVATGETKVLKVVSVHDCGRVINTLGGSNQVEGAVVQGIGYALTEERVVDPKTGIVLNANLEDYKVATAMDIFDIDHAFVNKPDEAANSLGAKGLGEPALIPTAPAIANAITRAIGIRFTSLPITRYRIVEALNAKKT